MPPPSVLLGDKGAPCDVLRCGLSAPAEKRASVRDLRTHGGDVLVRVRGGQTLTITSDGTPVAEPRPLPRRSLSAAELVARRRRLPRVDPSALRGDIDAILDQSL
jgi:antitoxin (DNA-binding transcriptional repressor) of toxin-antitoxin stability system